VGLRRSIIATFPVVPDALTPELRSRLMSRVRTRDTKPEILLRRALWAAGMRGWRLHPKTVRGRPDLAWLGRRVAVFVDGAFWHGHPDHYWGQSGKFWDEKIARNRARDSQINAELAESGWGVVRLWDFEVEREISPCIERVRSAWEAGDTSTSTRGA
jgi:DNA mismatch endonuclease (patch repair protein)